MWELELKAALGRLSLPEDWLRPEHRAAIPPAVCPQQPLNLSPTARAPGRQRARSEDAAASQEQRDVILVDTSVWLIPGGRRAVDGGGYR
jgi:hypothetical protein